VKPSILIVSTARWFTTARLAIAFAKLGCEVEAICPPGHALQVTKAVRRTHVYKALSPIDTFLAAIKLSQPNLIVVGDDLANKHVHDLYYFLKNNNDKASTEIRSLIERSIGPPDSYPTVMGRAAILELACKEGIRVPKTAVLKSIGDLEPWSKQMGFPLVLKTDGSSSGEGVRIANTLGEARRAFRTLQAPPQLIRVAKRVLIGRDMRWIRPTLERRRSVVNVQEFIRGRDATSLVACWKGEVLAALHFEVINKEYECGPSSVLRLIEKQEISATAEKIIRRLNLSGLHGFDFLIEKDTEKPYLIEMNPRATQVGHLALGPARDLPAALVATVRGEPMPNTEKVTENPSVALFPQEWSRDPQSPMLNAAYHDIPWEEPDLIRYCLRKTRKWSDWRSLEKWIYILAAHRSSTV
jgi:biotin carboxylase